MNFLRTVERVSAVVDQIASNATVVFFTVMTLIVWLQIFFRFILGGGIAWSFRKFLSSVTFLCFMPYFPQFYLFC
jgi:TRAP-type C4-dicarboxylate transport system permease small subunit